MEAIAIYSNRSFNVAISFSSFFSLWVASQAITNPRKPKLLSTNVIMNIVSTNAFLLLISDFAKAFESYPAVGRMASRFIETLVTCFHSISLLGS